MANRLVGLDISSRRLLAVEITGSIGRNPKLTQVHAIPLPEGAARDAEVVDVPAVSQALKQLWKDAGFKTKRVVLGVGNQRVLVRDLSVPKLPPSQLRQSLPYQVADLLPVPVSETILDFYPLSEVVGSEPAQMNGLLVAAIRESVESNVATLEDAGLKAVAVDLSPFGIVRALTRGNQLEGSKTIVMLGDRTTFIVVATDGVPQFVRIVPAGGEWITAAIEEAANLPFEEAEALKYQVGIEQGADPRFAAVADAMLGALRSIIGSVRSTNNYYLGNNTGAQIDGLIVMGRDTRVPGLVQAIGEHTLLPTEVGAPLAGITVDQNISDETLRSLEPELAIALGLALENR